MRILVTGSSGMLGGDLCHKLAGKHQVTGFDITQDPKANIKDFVQLDLTKENEVLDRITKVRPDIVVHCAAWTDVDGAEIDSEWAYTVNAEGTRCIANACKKNDALLIYLSTDFVFDGAKQTPYEVDDAPNPINSYGRSKLEGERRIQQLLECYIIVRTSWLFGRGGRNFVDVIINKAKEEKVLKVVTDQFGSPTYTKDLAEALQSIIDLTRVKTKDICGIYHISNSESCSWYRFAEEILRCTGLRGETELIPITSAELDRPAERPKMSVLSNKRYVELTAKPLRPWQEALKDYLTTKEVARV